MAVDAVIRSIQLATSEPLPERRITSIKSGVPVLIPTQHVGVFPEALRKILLAEALNDAGIGQIGLADKFRGRIIVFFLAPMNCDLSFASLDHHILLLKSPSHISHPL